MLKNIEKLKQKGLQVNPEFLKPELYSFQIPQYILNGLGLLAPGQKPGKGRNMSRISKRSSMVSEGGASKSVNRSQH